MKRNILVVDKRKQLGQSMTEYLVLSIIVMIILSIPMFGQPSVIEFFLSAVATGFDRFSGFMSLP
jgi:hypothetical protein